MRFKLLIVTQTVYSYPYNNNNTSASPVSSTIAEYESSTEADIAAQKINVFSPRLVAIKLYN